jgi:biopolymer transport protein ExbD
MRPNQQRSEGLICSIDVSAFAAITMVLVVTFMMMIPSGHGGVSADLPKVSHPMPMRKARREDAMTAAVMRTGDVFFGSNLEMKRCTPDQLPALIHDYLGKGTENKIYIRADARARLGRIREVLIGVRSAGVENVAFLVDERKTHWPRMTARVLSTGWRVTTHGNPRLASKERTRT